MFYGHVCYKRDETNATVASDLSPKPWLYMNKAKLPPFGRWKSWMHLMFVGLSNECNRGSIWVNLS
jgi:hypothetical protein